MISNKYILCMCLIVMIQIAQNIVLKNKPTTLIRYFLVQMKKIVFSEQEWWGIERVQDQNGTWVGLLKNMILAKGIVTF